MMDTRMTKKQRDILESELFSFHHIMLFYSIVEPDAEKYDSLQKGYLPLVNFASELFGEDEVDEIDCAMRKKAQDTIFAECFEKGGER